MPIFNDTSSNPGPSSAPRYLVWDCEMAYGTAAIWDLRIPGGYLNKEMLITRKRLLCVAAKFTGPDQPMHFFSDWDDPEGMLTGMKELLSQADASVTFNGLAADVKWLATEMALAGMAAPPPVRQVDLYRVIRTRFGLMSNSLAYACREFGVRNKTDSGGLATTTGAMQGNRECQERLAGYCKNDVLATEDLFHRVKSYIPNLPGAVLIGGLDGPSCPACGSTELRPRGWYYTKASRFRRYTCTCGKWVRAARRDAAVELTEIAA